MLLLQAIENGAVAALVREGFSSDGQPGVPLIPFADPRDALHRLAAAFYNDPSRRMTVVGVAGARTAPAQLHALHGAGAACCQCLTRPAAPADASGKLQRSFSFTSQDASSPHGAKGVAGPMRSSKGARIGSCAC